MKLSIQAPYSTKLKSTCLIVGVFANNKLSESAKTLDKETKGQIQAAIKASGFKASVGQTLPIYHPNHLNCEQILLVGCGDEKAVTPMMFRKINIAAAKVANCPPNAKVSSFLAEIPVKEQTLIWKVRQMAEATFDAIYIFDHFKTEREKAQNIAELSIQIPHTKDLKAANRALSEATAIAAAVWYTKDLANLPSNYCTPTYLVNTAKALAKTNKAFSIKVLDEPAMKKLGMGALLGVAKGSAEAAYLIIVEYKGTAKTKAPIALIGKGITFDTGGNSLKPADSMVGMKYDMCGGASVLGTLKATAELKLPINIVGIIPAVENMPGGSAYKPEDILTSLSGQTIEVISTDAEGRLILADALTYAERYKPEFVIDIATLTGAVVIALGMHASGLVSNDEKLTQKLLKAGTESNDRAWQLPLWDEYQEQIKSPFADISNTGGRPAGTITAGCFLSRFAKKFRWAHLDVAGTAAMMFGSDRYATGRPVPLLTQFLIDQTQKK